MKKQNFLERFVRSNFRSRLWLVCGGIIVAILFSVWSISGIYRAMGEEGGTGTLTGNILSEASISELFQNPEFQTQYPNTARFIHGFTSLEFYLKDSEIVEDTIRSLGAEEYHEIEKSVLELSRISQTELMSFVLNSMAPPLPPFRFRRIRRIGKLLSEYALIQKRKDPAFDILPFVDVLAKAVLLMEHKDRLLISKMISVKIQEDLLSCLHTLYLEGAFEKKEAGELRSLLLSVKNQGLGFQQVMFSEYLLFERMFLRMYQKAPFAFQLLELAFGDPLKPYRELIQGGFRESPKEFLKKNNHVLLQTFVPNFSTAQQRQMELEIAYWILDRELSEVAEENREPALNMGRVAILTDNDGKSGKYRAYYARYRLKEEEPLREFRLQIRP